MPSRLRKSIVILGFALPLAVSALARADLKIGYVDLQRALLEVEDGRRAKTKLQILLDQQKKAIDREQASLLKEKESLDQQLSGISHETRVQRQNELGKKAYDLAQRWEKENFDKMNPIIASIANREGMTFVFEKTDAGILYAPTYLDITNELVRQYNDPKRAKSPAAVKAGDSKSVRAKKK
jgi:outer membrane protein